MKTGAYYNEFDPQAAAWLRELIKRGHIADGDVDDRDMREISPDDIKGYAQHHFFAGIGGWSLALRMAGWPDHKPVLTGSPPCQPFSNAGKRLGASDERHLAPHFLSLVAALRPAFVFGEQVAAAIKKHDWLDDLLDAMEAEGYATGAIVLPACGVGAPHIRQRLWFTGKLADADSAGLDRRPKNTGSETWACPRATDGSEALRLADGYHAGLQGWERMPERTDELSAGSSGMDGRLADSDSRERDRVAGGEGRERDRKAPGRIESDGEFECRSEDDGAGPANSQWRDSDWLFCRDEKWRPVESGTFPLAHGLPARVGRLRGYGNAIVPQVAAEVIKVLMENGE